MRHEAPQMHRKTEARGEFLPPVELVIDENLGNGHYRVRNWETKKTSTIFLESADDSLQPKQIRVFRATRATQMRSPSGVVTWIRVGAFEPVYTAPLHNPEDVRNEVPLKEEVPANEEGLGGFGNLWGPPLPPPETLTPPVIATSETEAEYVDEVAQPGDAAMERAAQTPEYTVSFMVEVGRFHVYMEGKRKTVVNAREHFLLPGDRVSVTELDKTRVRVEKVEYATPTAVAGYIDARSSNASRRRGGLVFVVRVPGAGRAPSKYMYPADDIPGAEALQREGRPVLFDRKTKQIVLHPMTKGGRSSYEIQQWMLRVNMDSRRPVQDREEQAELQLLAAKYGARSWNAETVDERIEPALAAEADRAAAAGEVEDFRNPPEGKRVTMYIDPNGSNDHDDALSIEDKGEGWSEVGIHIADVAKFIAAGSALDMGAEFRGSSTYLVNKVLNMFPDFISEHLASLQEGGTRFTLSFVFEAKLDEQKKVRIRNMRFTPGVIKVTAGLTYENAQACIESDDSADEVTVAVKKLKELTEALYRRVGTRSLDEKDPDGEFTSTRLVAELMRVMNRARAESFERFRRSGKTRVRTLQDMVLGVYRMHELRTPGAEQEFKKSLLELGIVTQEEADSAIDFDHFVSETRAKVEAGQFDEATTEAYFECILNFTKTASRGGYTTEPKPHFAEGGVLYTRMTSPIRRYIDLLIGRITKFQLELRALDANPNDLTDEEVDAHIRVFMTEVLGIAEPKFPEGLSDQEKVEEVQRICGKHIARVFAHSSETESRSRQVANASLALRASSLLHRYLYGVDWDRNKLPTQSVRAFRMPKGLVVEIPDDLHTDADGMVYGQATVSAKENRVLASKKIRFDESKSFVLGVKFKLAKGKEHPAAWCRANGSKPCRIMLSGSVTGVEVEQNRIIFSMDPEQEYSVPKKAPRRKRNAK